jgi:hypothetical protein
MPILSAAARNEYYLELANCLPPPVTNSPENLQRRFATAVEAFEALRPGDAYEARLAVQIVLSGAHAADSLREAGVWRADFAKMTRCRAQAASLMREERAARRMLAQEQKGRLAAVAGAGPAQPTEAGAVAVQPARASAPPPARASAPPPRAEPQAAPPPVQAAVAVPRLTPAPPAVPQLRPAATQAAPQPESAPSPSPEAIAKAEAFMREEVVAAAQIRHDRGVTPRIKAYFRHLTLPTDPAVIDALVRGTSKMLTLLDEVGGETLEEAA